MKNKKGEIYVFICVFILCVMTVFSVIFTYASIITTARLQGKNATEGLNTAPFCTALKDFSTLDESDGMYYAVDTDGTEKYHMTVPQIGYLTEDALELYVTYNMYVPIRFGGTTVTTANIPVRISSILQSKIEPEEVTI